MRRMFLRQASTYLDVDAGRHRQVYPGPSLHGRFRGRWIFGHWARWRWCVTGGPSSSAVSSSAPSSPPFSPIPTGPSRPTGSSTCCGARSRHDGPSPSSKATSQPAPGPPDVTFDIGGANDLPVVGPGRATPRSASGPPPVPARTRWPPGWTHIGLGCPRSLPAPLPRRRGVSTGQAPLGGLLGGRRGQLGADTTSPSAIAAVLIRCS